MAAFPPPFAFAAACARGTAARHGVYDRPIRIDGTQLAAAYPPPQLVPDLDESTMLVERYRAIVRVLKTAVPNLKAPSDWVNVSIQLPEGTSWREYRITTQVQDLADEGEWRIVIETL